MGNCGSVESGESPLKETIADHEAPINCMALSEDGTILVYYICLWDIFLEKYFSAPRIESPTNNYTLVNKTSSNSPGHWLRGHHRPDVERDYPRDGLPGGVRGARLLRERRGHRGGNGGHGGGRGGKQEGLEYSILTL